MEFSCLESFQLNNCIHYGPIRVYRRRKNPPTLLTGRRSRYEQVSGEELIQRELRRQKKRFLSQKLKEKRDNIEKELAQQLRQLQSQESYLLSLIEHLQSYKNDLVNELEDPIVNLISCNDIPLFFQQYDNSSFDNLFSTYFNFYS